MAPLARMFSCRAAAHKPRCIGLSENIAARDHMLSYLVHAARGLYHLGAVLPGVWLQARACDQLMCVRQAGYYSLSETEKKLQKHELAERRPERRVIYIWLRLL